MMKREVSAIPGFSLNLVESAAGLELKNSWNVNLNNALLHIIKQNFLVVYFGHIFMLLGGWEVAC
jgi:hypothetical protein